MARIAFLGIAAASSIMALGQVARNTPEVAVGGKYESGQMKVESAGACSYSESAISCWDMQGAPSQELTDRVRSFFNGSSGQELGFRFNRKNRLLIFRALGQTSFNFEIAGGNYAQSYATYENGVQNIHMVRLAVDPKETTAAVILNHYNAEPSTVGDIPFAANTKGRVLGLDYEVGEWKEQKREKSASNPASSGFGTPQPIWGRRWSVVLGLTDVNGSISYTVLGKDGKPILYVDAKGNPVSAVQYLNSLPAKVRNGFNGFGYNGNPPASDKYHNVEFVAEGPAVSGANTYGTNVNPEKIGALRLSTAHQRRILFEGFPLDPKS